ncbi:MAG: hypothetical protein KA319_11830 [Ferruginibacter sp.]|nr:hypothetical protein [Ferruginibacter sp.]
MKKLFSKKIAMLIIAITLMTSLMSFSDIDNSNTYGGSKESTNVVASSNSTDEANITAAVRAIVQASVVATRVIGKAVIEAAEFVANTYTCMHPTVGAYANYNNPYSEKYDSNKEITNLQIRKIKNLD